MPDHKVTIAKPDEKKAKGLTPEHRRHLEPVDAVRFLQSFDLGKGDYTKERAHVLDLELDEIVKEIEKRRKSEPG